MKQFIQRLSSVPPHVAIILVLIGIIGASGAILLLKHTETKAEALVKPRGARLERLDGNVDIAQALNQASNDQLSWADATVNAPLTVGDRIWARGASHAQIALTGRNYVRINPDTSLDVLSLADRRTQLALRNGSALFDVGELTDGELYEVATPCGAVDFTQPGLYQLGIGDDGNTTISVLNGLAQVVGLAGSGVINKGEVLTLTAQVATQALVAHLAPDVAGNIVDDYYSYRYPNRYDHRYRSYDAYLDDPDYYDPYSRSVSYEYVNEEVPGLYDLDEYGDWQDINGYGQCWAPRVAADWSPYRQGYWDVDDVWGPTWVSSEPWGYAPYHYGRWAYVNQQRWVWVPEDCRTEAVYAPALVAFIPVQQTEIAWVPLAPGEPYVPRYYDASYAPQYLGSPQLVQEVVSARRTYANLNYMNAVTVVPVQAFTRPINQSVIVQANPQWIQQAQPVSDPYQVESVRQLAFAQERAERKQARREAAMFNRPVVTSVAPVVPQVGTNAAQALQYQPVPEKQKRNKLQFENSGQVATAQRADGVPLAGAPASQQAVAEQHDQRIAALRARLAQGDRSAKQELRQLRQAQRQQPAIAQPQQQAAPQAMSAKAQRRAERQQQMAQQPQAMQQAQQQAMTAKQQRRLERQQQMAAQQQQVEARRQQKQVARQQQAQQQAAQQSSLKAQRRAARQQQQQQMIVQQQAQVKQQRRAARQQQVMQQQQQGQAAQQAQIKAQRRAERQQQMVHQQAAQQQQWQMKQQRRAERQQQVVQQQQQVQQQQMRQQEKQQRRFERQQAAPQPRVYQAPAVQQSKAERKAERRKP
ncbi:MAG TPA: FecR family protein [Blastocatellia bacterium]|nr:FecR family protein [Blastocatellia bacterium]